MLLEQNGTRRALSFSCSRTSRSYSPCSRRTRKRIVSWENNTNGTGAALPEMPSCSSISSLTLLSQSIGSSSSSSTSGSRSINSNSSTNSNNLQNKKQQSHRLTTAALGLFVLILALLVQIDSAGTATTATSISSSSLWPSNNISGNENGENNRDGHDDDHHHHRNKDLERGKVLLDTTDKRIVAKSMHDAYREIQMDYKEKAFARSNENKWKLVNEKDDVTVSILQHPSEPSCPYVKLEAIFPFPVQDCWNFLKLSNWEKNMPKMDPFYEGSTLYGEYQHHGVHMILARKRTKRILAFGKRDFVFLSVSDQPLEDGTWVSGTVSVITPRVRREKGYTRAFQDSIAFYKPIPVPPRRKFTLSQSKGHEQDNNEDDSDDKNPREKTKVTIVCRIDLNDSTPDGSGGFIPMWLYVKTIGATGVKSVIGMRDALFEEMKQRQQHQKENNSNNTKKKRVLGWTRNLLLSHNWILKHDRSE